MNYPQYNKLYNIQNLEDIVLFGGTFAPIGNHHINALEQITTSRSESIVIIVPSIINPFKHSSSSASDAADYVHRINMLKIVEELSLVPRIIVWDLESDLARKYSIPIRTWQIADEICKIISIEYHRRNRIDHNCPNSKNLHIAIGSDLTEEMASWERAHYLLDRYGLLILDQNVDFHSTDIRRRIESGDPSWEDMIIPAIADYIKLHKLYGYSGKLR